MSNDPILSGPGTPVPLKTFLVFEPLTGGHRANFIRWLANEIRENPPFGCRFVFVVDSNSAEVSSDGIRFHRIDAGTAEQLAAAGRRAKSRALWKLFRASCDQFAPCHALILELTRLELSLALKGSPCPVSAILFVQYPELPRGMKFFFKHRKTALLLRRAPVRNLFLLNGEKSCRFLEKQFGSLARFIPVPDPAPSAEPDPEFVMRTAYRIGPDRRIFLFFGAISRRKGAELLMKALHRLSPSAAGQSAFVFCGEPEHGYRERFEQACAELRAARPDVSLSREAGFVTDRRMAALFEQSDAVLMPYLRPDYSSGVLALAARAGTPVIGPEGGLIGRLIRQYGLGTVCAVRPGALAGAIEAAVRNLPTSDARAAFVFAGESRPDCFAEVILNAVTGRE